MYSDALLDHFQRPRNVGELEPPARVVEVSNPVCGDILRLSARVEGGRVVEVRYKTRGCTASIAAGSALTELIAGKELEAVAKLTAREVEAALGGLPTESKHAAVPAVDAARALVRDNSGQCPVASGRRGTRGGVSTLGSELGATGHPYRLPTTRPSGSAEKRLLSDN